MRKNSVNAVSKVQDRLNIILHYRLECLNEGLLRSRAEWYVRVVYNVNLGLDFNFKPCSLAIDTLVLWVAASVNCNVATFYVCCFCVL